ncbi:MAG: MFS transporter [Chloroflexi bacterium]|nr:MFS transporter [Chloroflexota bacterium]
MARTAPASPTPGSREPIPIRRPLTAVWQPWRRVTWVTAATQVATQMGFGLGIPFMPLYVQTLGITDRAEAALWTGVLVGAAAVSMTVMSPIWGALSDRYGRKPMLIRSMLGGAFLIGGMGFVTGVQQLLILRLLQGALTGTVAAAGALVASAAPAAELGFALGLLNASIQLGNSIGPAFGGILVGQVGFRWTFIAGGALLGVGTLLAVFWVEEPPRPARSPHAVDPGNLLVRTLRPFGWRRFRGVLVLQVVTQFAYSATWALIPLYVQEMRLPPWLSIELAAGLGVTVSAIVAAMTTSFLGRLVDRVGAERVLAGALVAGGIAYALQSLVPDVWAFLALRLAVGLGVAGSTAALAVLTKTTAPSGREGAAYGAVSAAQALGWGLGPLLGAGVVAVLGIPALYLASGVVMLVSGGSMWRRRL